MSNNLLQLTPRANARSKYLSGQKKSIGRMGFRFQSDGRTSLFTPLDKLQTGDLVLQPVSGGTVVFVDPKTAELAFAFTVDVDEQNQWIYKQTDRKIADKKDAEKMKKENSTPKKKRIAKSESSKKEDNAKKLTSDTKKKATKKKT